MAIYSKHCSTVGCDYIIKAEAPTDAEALTKMVANAKNHLADVHPETPIPDDQTLENDIKAGWSKDELSQNV